MCCSLKGKVEISEWAPSVSCLQSSCEDLNSFSRAHIHGDVREVEPGGFLLCNQSSRLLSEF